MDQANRFALFDTALGTCAVVCGAAGLTGILLPSARETAIRDRLARYHPRAVEAQPSSLMADAITRIQALLVDGAADLDPIELDLSATPDFERAVYKITRAVSPGQTITYGEIARQVSDISDSRRVGQALGRNPWPIVIPCHRVLGADGKAGGFSAPGAVDTKLMMLNLERAQVGQAPRLFDDLPLAVKPRA